MGLLSQKSNEINNELSAVLRVIRSHFRNEIKLQIINATCIEEFKVKILRKHYGYYKFLFLIKIPKEYPYEPLWAEPVIVSHEMMMQFRTKNFRCLKLRPLIDSLVVFCHKYDSPNIEAMHISFPVMKIYGEKEITAKVYILLNKAFSKFNNRLSFDYSNRTSQKSHVKLSHNSDFYNDMGISMVEYINMINQLSNSKKKKKTIMSKIDFNLTRTSDKKEIKTKYLINHSKEIKRQLSKTLFNHLNQRTIKRIRSKHREDLDLHNRNLTKVGHSTNPYKPIPAQLFEYDLLEETAMDIEVNFRVILNIFNNYLSQRHDVSGEFINLLKFTYILAQDKPFTIPIEKTSYKENRALVLMHSREIVPVNPVLDSTVLLIKFLIHLNKLDFGKFISLPLVGEHHLLLLSNCVPNCIIESPRELFISDLCDGFIVDESTDIYMNENFISNIISEENCFVKPKTLEAMGLHIDSENINQPFLKDRIAQRLMLHGDLPNSTDSVDNVNDASPPLRSQLTVLYSEIISEVIQYPKSGKGLFEYTLELNPRSARHRILLDCIGLLKYMHYTQLEILAPNDYTLRLFFIKEIFNPNGRGVVIKLHKLCADNIIYKLIVEENNYFLSLSKTNKCVWCTEVTSTFNLDLFKLIFNLGKMYFQKQERTKKMKVEGTTYNCPDLSIQRYHFTKEIVESLLIFDNASL